MNSMPTLAYRIDLNCDMGESFGRYTLGYDAALMKWVSSVNIACGFHAGDPSVMRETVAQALENGVQIGAHPSYPDLQGFGRRSMRLTPQEIYDLTLYQIGALAGFVQVAGGRLHHVKPHGALYNDAALHPELAQAIVQAVYDFDAHLVFYGLARSEMLTAAAALGLKTAHEAFADRRYLANGHLVPRSHPVATISSETDAIAHVLSMILRGEATSLDGQTVRLRPQTICIHGDQPQALVFAQALHQALTKAGIQISAAF